MHNNDWPLIFFTLLSKFGVGLMVYFTALYFINHSLFQTFNSGFSFKSPEFIVLIAVALSIVFSFFHLGFPLHAVNALNHLSSSWLSREIFAVLLFSSSVLLVFLFRMLNPQVGWILPGTLLFSALAGIFLVAVISRIYLIETIPSWNSWHTPAGFYMSAITLGAAGIIFIALLHFTNPEESFGLPKFVNQISRILAAALAIEILITLVFQVMLAKDSPAGIEQISFTSGTYHTLHLVRIFILFVALVFAVCFIFSSPGISNNFQAYLRFFAMIFALTVVEEVIGHYQFFASYFRIGV